MASGGSSGSSSLRGPDVLRFVQGFDKEFGPVRNEFLGQLLQLLQTGGVPSRLPLIQGSVERGRAALSQQLGLLKGQAAEKGVGADDPFLRRLLAQTQRGGEFGIGQSSLEILQGLLSTVPGLTLGSVGQFLQALSNVGASESNTKQGGVQLSGANINAGGTQTFN